MCLFGWNKTTHVIKQKTQKIYATNRIDKKQQHRNNNRAVNVVHFINRLDKNKIQTLNTKSLKKTNRNQTQVNEVITVKSIWRQNITCIGTRIEQTAYITRLDKQHTQVINLRGGLQYFFAFTCLTSILIIPCTVPNPSSQHTVNMQELIL